MNEVWNLDPIYRGFDDPAFERDMQALKAAVSGLEAFSRNLSGFCPSVSRSSTSTVTETSMELLPT